MSVCVYQCVRARARVCVYVCARAHACVRQCRQVSGDEFEYDLTSLPI